MARAGAIPTRAGTSPAQRAPASATSRRVSSSPAGVLSDVDAAALAYGQGVLSGDEDDGESDEELEMPDDPSSSSDSGEEPEADQGVDDEALMGVDLDGIVAMATAASVAHPPVAVRPPPKRVSTADAEFQAKSLYFLHFDCEHTGTHVCQVQCQHPFCRPHRLQANDGRSTFYSHEYCNLAPTTFGLKIYRGDVKKWSRGNIELDYRQTPLGTLSAPVL